MKTILKKRNAADEPTFEKFQLRTTILMILFFVIFGAASLYVLINSQA